MKWNNNDYIITIFQQIWLFVIFHVNISAVNLKIYKFEFLFNFPFYYGVLFSFRTYNLEKNIKNNNNKILNQ